MFVNNNTYLNRISSFETFHTNSRCSYVIFKFIWVRPFVQVNIIYFQLKNKVEGLYMKLLLADGSKYRNKMTTHDTKPSLTKWQWLSRSRNYLFLWIYAQQLITEPYYGTAKSKSHLYVLVWYCIKPSWMKCSLSHRFSRYVHSGNNFKLCFPWCDRSRKGRTSAQDRGVQSATHSNHCNLHHPGIGDSISHSIIGTTARS
jgi:hypothetical protein